MTVWPQQPIENQPSVDCLCLSESSCYLVDFVPDWHWSILIRAQSISFLLTQIEHEVPFVLACSRTLGQSESHWVLAFINTCCPVQIITLKYLFLPSLCFSQTLLCSSGSCLYNSELLAATPSPVVFCHNDVQEGKTFFCFNHILLSRCSLILTPLILDDWSTVWLCWHIA